MDVPNLLNGLFFLFVVLTVLIPFAAQTFVGDLPLAMGLAVGFLVLLGLAAAFRLLVGGRSNDSS